MVCAITMLFGVLVSFAYFSNLPRTTAVADRLATAGNAQADDELVYQIQSLEVYPDEENKDKSVTLHGLMPEGAEASAVDVTDDYVESGRLKTMSIDGTMTENGVIAAYDITINDASFGDGAEFQPIENYPITVTINDPRISLSENLEIWHVKDDGTREKVENIVVEEGKVCFEADGFSVYEIVDGPGVYEPDLEHADSKNDLVVDLDDDEKEANNGLVLYVTLGGTNKYFTNNLNNNSAFVEVESLSKASKWYIESNNNSYYIYTYIGGVKKYISNSEGNLVSLADEGTPFDININNDDPKTFYFKVKNQNKWLQHSGGGSGIRLWTDKKNTENSKIKVGFASSLEMPDDIYNLDGKTYGFLNYPDDTGTYGYGMIAKINNNNQLLSQKVITKLNPLAHTGINLIAEDASISLWSFKKVSGDIYTLSTEVNGVTKYLKLDASGAALVEENEASQITVVPGSGAHSGKIKLKAGDKTVDFSSNVFKVIDDTNKASSWLTLAETSNLIDDDFVVYSASKVSVSDNVNVANGKSVIVYTRVWDNDLKKYYFYAVDHDGTLVPCYERGDSIMWIGSQINTLLWDFTEYYYAGTTTPNYYYELYNPYSRKYLAPQINGGQVLSDNAIGINLPGRRADDYYTDILAWDDPYYTYAGLKADMENDKVVSTSRANAETFYFAVMEPVVNTFTEVDTIDNTEYGITMKLTDYTTKPTSGHNEQDSILGDNTIWENHKDFPKSGILSTNLVTDSEHPDRKYPTTSSGESLYELYKDAKDVNHLFIASTYNASGYFEYDSCQNFATLKGNDSGNFTVYKEIGTSDSSNKTTLKHGQFLPYNDLVAGKFASANGLNLYDALQNMLPESDPRKYEKLYLVETPNYYFGMELGAKFEQTPSGKDDWGHDMIFEFTGDDDFWLYVDDELVIDLGGIHSALEGKVNFATGDVVVDDVPTNLRDIFANNYLSRLVDAYKAQYPEATEAQIETYKNSSETKALVNAYLAQYFDYVNGEYETVFKDYSSHTMKIFYMERGAGASNLHMRFNLSYVTPGSVVLTKEISGSDDIDFTLVEYPYQIWYKDQELGEFKLLRNNETLINVTYQNSTQKATYKDSYTPPNGNETYEAVYFINPGKSAEIHFPINTIEYKIIECGINRDVYDSVKVNGTKVDPEDGDATDNYECYSTGEMSVADRPRVTFDNHVDPEGLRTLTIEKELYDENGNKLDPGTDSSTFSYRLYLSNGVDDSTLALAYMYKYSVRHPNGKLCRWDAATQSFLPTEYEDYKAFGSDEASLAAKALVTFETSTNGTISKIPAGYKVEVYYLPVGTKFKVEEREWDNPLGYKLMDYERDAASFIQDDGDTKNSGRIRANQSPVLKVKNKRGWGLQVNKIWSDKDFTSNHDDVYFAVYKVNPSTGVATLVDGTVKKMAHPDTSIRYFFDDIDEGYTFNDYEIREVELTDPVANSEGVVTFYSTIKPVEDGGFTQIGSVPNSTNTREVKPYKVTYEQGNSTNLVTNNTSAGAVRNDTVLNTRGGGIEITLYKWESTEKLAGGKFELKEQASGRIVGTFTTDSRGRVTVLYDEDGAFNRGVVYELTEIESPSGYIGLPNSVIFWVTNTNVVEMQGNGGGWDWLRPTAHNDSDLIAYIDLYNKPYTFESYKCDKSSNEHLEGAHFALYEGKTSAQGDIIKDYYPMAGYEDLVTDAQGLIPGIDNTLIPGKYYLTETAAPEGYEGLKKDIVFTISKLGRIEVEDSNNVGYFDITGDDDSPQVLYIISVPNTRINVTDASLTITKTVKGSMGDKSKDFEFTFSVDGATATDEYAWTKNGVAQTALHSGDTFTLRHNDTAVFTLAVGAEVTVTETAVTGYETTFKLNSADAEEVNTKTFTIEDDTTLAVTNTMGSIVPSGVIMKVFPVVAIGLIVVIVLGVLIFRSKRRDDEDEEETDEE